MKKRMIISADSHVVEPFFLYKDALGRKYGDAIPRAVGGPPDAPRELRLGEAPLFYFTGYETLKLASSFDSSDELRDTLTKANEDPGLRLKCLDEDGVFAELMCATALLLGVRSRNDDMVRDCCQVFNDWLIEYCSHAPKRLFGTGMFHMQDVGWAVRELDRVGRSSNIKCIMINADTRPEWRPYRDPIYDPFWAKASEMNIPVMLHIITGNKKDPFVLFGDELEEVARVSIDLFNDAPITLANEFIFGGIMDRFPKLRLVLGEYEVSWIPYWLFRAEQVRTGFGPVAGMKGIKHPVKEYMKRIYQGVIDDPYVYKVTDVIDVDTIMWGSDFPHVRCTYPNSLEVVNRIFGKMGEEAKEKISLYNAARFYGIELPPELQT